MNYSEALSFTFRDDEWLKKIGIGGLINYFCIFTFFVVGYYLNIMRNVWEGSEKPLPSWSDISKIFVDGVLGTIIALIYIVVIGGLCALIITSIAMDDMATDGEKAMGIVFTSILTIMALCIFINIGLIQFATTENFGAAFNPALILSFLKDQAGNLITIVIFSQILNAILFLAGLGILSPMTNFWGFMVQAHLWGQCVRNWQTQAPALQSP